jgi:hypothetical protein
MTGGHFWHLSKKFLLVAFFTISALTDTAAAQSEKTKINLAPQPGTIVTARAQLEFEGDVIGLPNAAEEESNPSVRLRVSALHSFDQIHVDRQNALRKYAEAYAKISLEKRDSQTTLAPANQQIVVRRTKSSFGRPIQYFALGSNLTQPELELLLIPCDLLALSEALHNEGAKINEQWTPSDLAAQALFSLDHVAENNLVVTLKEVSPQQLAKLYITGDVRGEVDGCQTAIRISAVAVVDGNSTTLKAFRANLAENRQPSQLAPGFHGTVKIDLACSVKGNRDLDDQVTKQVSAKINEKQSSKLLWNSDSEFELVYDPKWRLILSDTDVVLLRYADQGNVLAQCNIMSLPKRPADKPLSLTEFQSQLTKNVIGKSQAKIQHAETINTANGLTAMQVNVAGIQDEVPITWLYYHLSDPSGRCVALVFIAEDSAIPSLKDADLKLVESIRFVPHNRKAEGNKPAQR